MDDNADVEVLELKVGDDPKIPKDSFVDLLYEAVNKVVGGRNNEQFFMMTLPGTLLTPEDYKYDAANNQPKPAYVMANEAKLADKLFDPCPITGSDNGRKLSTQYKSALDMLTPKLNKKIADAKTALRQLILSPYPYDFGNGVDPALTLQQVFYKLYDQWIKLKMDWNKLQSDKKSELHVKYPGGDAKSNQNYQNEWLTWYQDIAEGYIEALNEQMGKILAIFSINDMKIIEGVLDSGSGAEIQEARELLENTRKANPDGGYIYPVTMTPSNWASLLDTSFTGVDLLDSPYVLSQRMSQLTNQKINLQAQIDQITAVIPEDAELKKLTDDYYNSKQKLSDAETKLTGTYMNGGALVFKTALNIAGAAGKLPDGLAKRFGESIDAGKQPGGSLDDFVTKLTTAIEDGQKAQQALIDASQKLSDAQAAYISEKNLSTLGPLLTPLRADMQKLDAEIKDLADKIQISGSISGNTNTTSPPPPTPPTPPPPPDANQIAPNKIPPGFMQIVMDQESSTMKTETKKSSTAQNSSYGATFFFGGYQHSDSHSSSAFSSFTKDEKCKIQVGLAVAKVAIERDWFNPGVFALTDDMCNVTTSRISPNKVYRGFDDARFEAMRGSSSHTNIFPCFPTAFVVARDITIRITTENSFSHHDASSVEDHASSGGGFLCFSGSSSSSSSSSASSAHVSANANTITIRMTDPQIIGYYIEAVPPDNSVMIDQVIEQETSAGFVTVEDFVKDYRKVLTGYADSVKENSADKSMKGGGAA